MGMTRRSFLAAAAAAAATAMAGLGIWRLRGRRPAPRVVRRIHWALDHRSGHLYPAAAPTGIEMRRTGRGTLSPSDSPGREPVPTALLEDGRITLR
ncbi:MAG TPA: twin-arginine translocation signal domain-containing protein [Longimicrobiaceae bacterium]|nr:twin-arginine translocation signal domain-containing protein [Longimicrobiaceae bacterium]